MFKIFKRSTSSDSKFEIDESVIKESQKPKDRPFLDYKNYRDKPIDWLIQHLKVINEVVNNKKLGTKQQSNFILDGKKIYKNEITKVLFNEMFDSYTAYYFSLKRYIIVRRELEQIEKIREEEYLIAGKAKEFNLEATRLEKNMNVHLDNILQTKAKIKREIFN
ncbi:MAG: hypothetical protein WCY27_02145 [archaeon]|nr:hypothetical protein [archaeon]MDD2477718.1 hypothetical protein [Candidatus ainarchaeum sp.]MDD3084571.1 hypothetical protein [Candidatus ainarchaeum sp.]MDD4221295.1 hypothetical protein [Candidatus ainarchaeum sp.]MDD4662771.1 hypothetical protein [Candidatus ainarchaeum sp.]